MISRKHFSNRAEHKGVMSAGPTNQKQTKKLGFQICPASKNIQVPRIFIFIFFYVQLPKPGANFSPQSKDQITKAFLFKTEIML